MSTALVEKAIAKFVASPQPGVLCIRGKWGVGKTHTWKAGLAAAKAKDAVGLNSYAYVSMFEINGLDELKYAIFENSVSKADIGVEPSVETFQNNTSRSPSRLRERCSTLRRRSSTSGLSSRPTHRIVCA